MTFEAFTTGLALLAQTFDKPVAEEVGEAYLDMLRDLTDAQWAVAVRRCVAECVHFPRPVELRERAPVAQWVCPHAPPCNSPNWCEVLRRRALGETADEFVAAQRRQWVLTEGRDA